MLSIKTRKALTKYGPEVCKRAHHLNRVQGEGASSISQQYLDLTTRQVDAAINAYAEWEARRQEQDGK